MSSQKNLNVEHSTKISKCKGVIHNCSRTQALLIIRENPNLIVTWLPLNMKWNLPENTIIPEVVVNIDSHLSTIERNLIIAENNSHNDQKLIDLRKMLIEIQSLNDYAKQFSM